MGQYPPDPEEHQVRGVEKFADQVARTAVLLHGRLTEGDLKPRAGLGDVNETRTALRSDIDGLMEECRELFYA